MNLSTAHQFDSSWAQQFVNSEGHQRNGEALIWEARIVEVMKIQWGVWRRHEAKEAFATVFQGRDVIELYTTQTELLRATNPAGGGTLDLINFTYHVNWITGAMTNFPRALGVAINTVWIRQPLPLDWYEWGIISATGMTGQEYGTVFPWYAPSGAYGGYPTELAAGASENDAFNFNVTIPADEGDPAVQRNAYYGIQWTIRIAPGSLNPFSQVYQYANEAMDTVAIESVPWQKKDTRRFNEYIMRNWPSWPPVSELKGWDIGITPDFTGCDGSLLPQHLEGLYVGNPADTYGPVIQAGALVSNAAPAAVVSKMQIRSRYAPYIVVREEQWTGYVRPFTAADYSQVAAGIARDNVPVDIPSPTYADTSAYAEDGEGGFLAWRSRTNHAIYFNLTFAEFLRRRERGEI